MDQSFARRTLASLNVGAWPTYFLLAAVPFFTGIAFKLRFVQDDAFISYRYAENLAQGVGLVFNPGQAVEGYTNFLWTLLLAAGMKLGVDPVTTSYALGLTCFVGSLLLTFSIGRSVLGSNLHAILALLFLGTNYSFLCYATGGLETQLQTFLFLTIVSLTIGMLRVQPLPKSLLLAVSVLCALALMTRLDSAICVAICGVALLARIRNTEVSTSDRLSSAAALLGPALVLVGAWLAWKLSYYGSVLPNTYQVKVAGGTSIIRGLGYALIFLTSYFLIAHVFIAAAFTKRILRESDSAQLLLATLIGVWSAYVVWVGGDFMEFRFFVPILPLAFVLLVWVLVTMIEQQPVRLAAIALVFAGSVYHWKYYETKQDIGSIWELRRYMETPAEDWPGVGRALFELFGRDADGVTIAVLPTGAVPYYSKLKTIDMLGLNDPWVARHGIEIGSLPGHNLLAPLQYLVDSGAHLVVSGPRVEPKNAPRVPYDIDEVARFLIQPVSADELPDNARFVEFSVNDSHRITVLYLLEHPAVEKGIQNGNLSVFPVLR